MIDAFRQFQAFPGRDRQDIFEATAARLDTVAPYVEKDAWVCLLLDVLFNHLQGDRPSPLFKGGTSLSKAFGLIDRFSEDIDIVLDREGLGFGDGRDPTVPGGELSNKARKRLFADLKTACADYVQGRLCDDLTAKLDDIAPGCVITPDEFDGDRATLLVAYPTLFPGNEADYVAPRVKIECGARSAMTPARDSGVTPYMADELSGTVDGFAVAGVVAIAPERTFWEKLLILHGAYCGYRDQRRMPQDRNRISRHYYDAALLTDSGAGRTALADHDLLAAVREHNLIAFPASWKRFEEAVPGGIRLVPEGALANAIRRDYAAMQDMIYRNAPDFEWVIERLREAEETVNSK